jgi:hypothetical protein
MLGAACQLNYGYGRLVLFPSQSQGLPAQKKSRCAGILFAQFLFVDVRTTTAYYASVRALRFLDVDVKT